MQNGDLWDRLFYPTLILMKDSYIIKVNVVPAAGQAVRTLPDHKSKARFSFIWHIHSISFGFIKRVEEKR